MAEQLQESTSPTVKDLHEALKDLKQWETFGINLRGIEYKAIEEIKRDRKNTEEQKLLLYNKWLNICTDASWKDVVTALNKMDEAALARKVENTHRTTKTLFVINGKAIEKQTPETITDSGLQQDKSQEINDGYQYPLQTVSSQNHTLSRTPEAVPIYDSTEDDECKKNRQQSIKTQKKVTLALEFAKNFSEEKTTVMEEGDREKDKMEKAVIERDTKLSELTQENKRLKNENSTLELQVAKLEKQLNEKDLIIMKIKIVLP